MGKVEIDGKQYKVVESLPHHGCGMPAKFVETPSGDKVAVKQGGKWRFWTVTDRIS